VVASLAWAFVEIFRSTPLISLLLAADLLIPLLLPPSWQVDKVWRAYGAITLLTAAYLAEVLRGTLQTIPQGQRDAASALGLNRRLAFWLVVLPQVYRIGLPAFANIFVGAIKDTSLVIVIGLLDITGAARAAVAEPQWRAHGPEIYMLVAAIYFALCFPIAYFVARQDAGTISRRRSMKTDMSASSL
jgi:general L-amino acid transport system permease protein